MGHKGRAGVKDGKDGDEDDQVDVWCFPERDKTSTELRRRLGVEATGDVMRPSRLSLHGHVEWKDDADCVKACSKLVVEGKATVGIPKKTWQNNLLKIDPRDIHNRVKWRAIGRCNTEYDAGMYCVEFAVQLYAYVGETPSFQQTQV